MTVTVTNPSPDKIGTTNVYSYTIISKPLNDDFANATKVASGGGSFLSNNRFATIQTAEQEPAHAGDTNVAASLWWVWTASTDTNVLVDTRGSAFQAVLAVYVGTSVNSNDLVQVAATNGLRSAKPASLTFAATAGTAYRIAVASPNSTNRGSINLRIAPGGQQDTTAPTVAVVSPLSGMWLSNKYVLVTGTASDPLPNASGVSQVQINVNGVWQFVAVGTNNWSKLIALLPGLNNVHVTAVDVASNASAPFNLELTYFLQLPANDLFAQALPLLLTNSSGTVSANTTNAAKEFGEPDITDNPGGRSVWWYFQPPADGVLTLDTGKSPFDTLLGIYTGSTVAALTPVAENDDAYPGAPGGYSYINQAVRSSQTYYIDGYDGAYGPATLSYSFTPGTVYHLTTTSSAGGTVSVTSTNARGGLAEMPGAAGDFAALSTAVLTATPDTYYAFNGWTGSIVSSDNPLSVVMQDDYTLNGNFVATTFTDGFESGNLLHLPWVTSGDAPWFVQSSVVAFGNYAARSGVIGNNQSSSLRVTLNNFVAGIGSFDYRVSTETNFDSLSFYVNGNLVHQWSGEMGWASFSFPLAAGTHTLQWT